VKLSVWLAIAVAGLALIETANALIAPHRVAGASDWQAAAAEVRAGFRDGDLIVFAPAWSDQVGRAQLGDLMPLDMVARSDDARYRRIWEVSTRRARAPETRDLKATRTSEHGPVKVALYEKPSPPAEVTWDSTKRSSDAIVSGRAEPRTLEIDYQPRLAILAPLDQGQGKSTSLEWRDVPLGDKLVGWVGLHDYYARKHSDAPIDFTLFVDGRAVHHMRVTNADGWKRFEVPTSSAPGTVRVELSSPSAAWRNAGFHLEARK
jgi:hypothetical protein